MSSSSAALTPAGAAPVKAEAVRPVSGAVYGPALPTGAASTSAPAPLQSTSPNIRVYEQSDVNCANPQYPEISLPYERRNHEGMLQKSLVVCVDSESVIRVTLHVEVLGYGPATQAIFRSVRPGSELVWQNYPYACSHVRRRAEETITVGPGKYGLQIAAGHTGSAFCGTKKNDRFNYIYADLSGEPIPRTYGSGDDSRDSCAYNDYTGSALDPVNTLSGNFTYQFTDFSLPSRGLPLVFERSYNSRDTYPGPLGQGWTHTYNTQLWFETGRVVWLSARGARLGFTANDNGSFTPETGIRATLAFTQNTYTLTQGDNLVYTFNPTGTLTSVSTGLGHTTALSYTDGLLTGIQGEDGRALTLTYDDHRRIKTIQDPISRTAIFTYTDNALTAYQDPSGQVWTYTYAGSLLTALAAPNGGVLSHGYDAQMRVITQTNPLGAASTLAYAPGLTTIYDANGHITQHHYDDDGALVGVTDASGHTIAYTRDANQNIIGVADAAARTVNLEWNARACSPAVLTDTLGHVTTMSYDDANQLTGVQDALGRATQYGYDGHRLITITDALGGTVIHTYDANNLRVQTVDHGLTTTYGYDAFGQVTAITDTLGQVTRYGYDAVGRLITTTNPAGQVTVNEYDARDNLLRVTTNYTTAGGQNYLGLYNQVTTYAYSPADLWGQSRRTWMTDTHGRVTRYEYDLAGRLTRATRNYLSGYPQNHRDTFNLVTEYGYDAMGNQVAVTDTLGNVTYTEYDALGRVTRTWQNYLPGYPQNYQNTYNRITEYGYDTVGNQILVTDTASSEMTLGNVTYTEYDALDRVARTWQNYLPGYPQNYQDTYNRVTAYGYDAVGNQTLITDTLGNVTYTGYDALNRPVTVTTNFVDGVYDPNFPTEDLHRVTTYDAAGRVSRTQDAGGRITVYEYDTQGRQIAVIQNYQDGSYDPARPDEDVKQVTVYDDVTGRVTARWQIADTTIPTWYEYDVLGRLVTTTNALSGTTVTQYDALGRRSASIDAAGNVTHYGYDVAGRLVTTTNALEGAVVTSYDALGRRVAQTNPLGHTTVYTYDSAGRLVAQADPLGHVAIYSYDALGHRVAQTDADGVSLYSTYDAAGRLSSTCTALGHCVAYTYDALGRRVAQTDARGIVTRYEYDTLGHLTAVVENATTTGLSDYQTNVRTEYTYDGSGNLRQVQNALGHTTVYTYDLAGRRVAEADALGNVTTYVYDGHGRRLAAVYPDAGGPFTVTAAYNALGWTEEVVYPGVGDAPGFTVTYGYTPLGHRAAVTDATGALTYDYDALYRPLDIAAPTGNVTYTYDAAGQRTHLIYPTGQTVTYTHDAAGRLTQVLDWSGGTTVYTYTDAGRLSGMARPNGVTSAYSYDSAGRLAQIEHRDPAANLLARYIYTLDGVSNRTLVTETVSGATRSIAYTYDPLNRLTAAAYSTGEFYSYQYDAVGNRVAMTVTSNQQPVTSFYTYDAANRLTGIERPDSSLQTYTWDARGNLIHDDVFTYTYNAAGRMVRAASITTTLVYTYTADGLRVAQAQSVSSVESVDLFTWDWATPVPEMLYDGQYTYLVGHDTLGWEGARTPMAPVMWTYVLPDALGSVRQETDAAGAVTAVREWSPYGEEVGGAQTGLGFTGEWFDANVGLQYLRARWYQPETGRFTSRDPWEGRLSQPQTILYPYWYGLMNPITVKDTSGTKPERGFPYSCNCGFIDESHFDASSDSMAAQIIQRVRNAEVGVPFDLPPLPNGKPVNLPFIGEFWVGQEVNRQVLIKQELTIGEMQEVALGIFQAVEDASEKGWAQTVGGSRYSEEDLISNLLGFYYALGGEYTLENIKLWCGYLDEKKSIEVYDWYEKNLGFTKIDEWGKPRLATCANKRSGCGFLWLAKCPICPLDKYCSEERVFPVDKFDIEPEPEGNKWEFVDPKPARFIVW